LNYTLGQKLKLAIWLFFTKMLIPSARLIRFPIDIRGKQGIFFGKHLTTGKNCRIEAYPESDKKVLIFGNNVQLNDNVHIAARSHVYIGDNVLIASRIFISDITHGSYRNGVTQSSPESIPATRDLTSTPVIIEENVWIGEGVCVLPGAHIGKGSIIGANSVVSKKIPSGCIAVGIPAKVIKKYNYQNNEWEVCH